MDEKTRQVTEGASQTAPVREEQPAVPAEGGWWSRRRNQYFVLSLVAVLLGATIALGVLYGLKVCMMRTMLRHTGGSLLLAFFFVLTVASRVRRSRMVATVRAASLSPKPFPSSVVRETLRMLQCTITSLPAKIMATLTTGVFCTCGREGTRGCTLTRVDPNSTHIFQCMNAMTTMSCLV